MILPTVLTLLLNQSKKIHNSDAMKMLVITLCWAISDVPIIYIIPNGWDIFKEIFLFRYGSFISVSIIYYAFIKIEHIRDDLKTELKFLAWHDPLTNLLNRAKFVEVVEDKKSKATQHNFVAMIDIDHFKLLNDTYGHLVGDDILIEISSILKKYENNHFVVARFGGEEFIIYLEAEDTDIAIRLLEQIRTEISGNKFYSINKNLLLEVTISIGMIMLDSRHTLLESIDFADKNLYDAKNNGRNCLFFEKKVSTTKEKAVQV